MTVIADVAMMIVKKLNIYGGVTEVLFTRSIIAMIPAIAVTTLAFHISGDASATTDSRLCKVFISQFIIMKCIIQIMIRFDNI